MPSGEQFGVLLYVVLDQREERVGLFLEVIPNRQEVDDRVPHFQSSTGNREVEPPVGNILYPESLLDHLLNTLDNATTCIGEDLLLDSVVRLNDLVGVGASETLSRISKISLKEPEVLVVRVDEAEHRLGGCELSTELGNVDVDAGLVNDEPAFLGVEFEESPLTARGSNGKARIYRSTDADDTGLFHVEGKADQRGVLLHFRPGCSANFRIVVPKPEIIVDSVQVESGCALVHREVNTEEDCFTAEDLIIIKDMSGVGYGTQSESYVQRVYGQ